MSRWWNARLDYQISLNEDGAIKLHMWAGCRTVGSAVSKLRTYHPILAFRFGQPVSALVIWLLCGLALTGCTTAKGRARADAEMLRTVGFWQPHQMYLLASPHARLHVEVDAVEGCSPSEATLNRLRLFLATWCQKPGGIEIVRSDVIPAKMHWEYCRVLWLANT